MKKCPVCGKENRDEDLFCASCGAKLPDKVPESSQSQNNGNTNRSPSQNSGNVNNSSSQNTGNANNSPFQNNGNTDNDPSWNTGNADDGSSRNTGNTDNGPSRNTGNTNNSPSENNGNANNRPSQNNGSMKNRRRQAVLIAIIAGAAIIACAGLVFANIIIPRNQSGEETAAISADAADSSASGSSAEDISGSSAEKVTESSSSAELSEAGNNTEKKINPLLPTASDQETGSTSSAEGAHNAEQTETDGQSQSAGLSENDGQSHDTESSQAATPTASAESPSSDTAPEAASGDIESATATSVLSEKNHDHSPGNVLDGDTSTAWSEGADGNGEGEALTLTLKGERRVSGMEIRSGYQKTDDLFQKNSRPSKLEVSFSDGTSETVNLEDRTGWQTITFSQPHTTESVTLTIRSVYPGWKYEDTLITDVTLN